MRRSVMVRYSGLGGAVYDSRGKPKFFFSEEVSPSLLSDIRDADQITVIQELEMLALLVAVSLWCPVFRSHRVVAFSDSEAVRGSFLLRPGLLMRVATTSWPRSSEWRKVHCAKYGWNECQANLTLSTPFHVKRRTVGWA